VSETCIAAPPFQQKAFKVFSQLVPEESAGDLRGCVVGVPESAESASREVFRQLLQVARVFCCAQTLRSLKEVEDESFWRLSRRWFLKSCQKFCCAVHGRADVSWFGTFILKFEHGPGQMF